MYSEGGAPHLSKARQSLQQVSLIGTAFLPISIIEQRWSTASTMNTSIPLHCNICPKLPKFSDLSHLLTHVASKGHLSHYFKAQVRSASEPSVRKELDTFDAWYDRYRIGKLMCQRLKSKDNKPIKTERNRRVKQESIARESTNPAPAQLSKQKQAKVKRESVIDPQLVPIAFATSVQGNDEELELRGQITRPVVPYMSSRDNDESPKDQLSQQQAGASTTTLPYPFLNDGKETRARKPRVDEDQKSVYPDPTTIGFGGADAAAGFDLGSTGSSLTSITSDTPDFEDQQAVAECAKLKGTIWPGMDLFDSANALAKRRRNQKKDGSILAQMMWTSATVRPRETVYTLGGTVHRIQPITGQIESSPYKQLTPKPKRARGKAKRTVLAPVDVNAARTKRPAQSGAPPRRRGRPRIHAEPPETPSKPPKEVAGKKPVRKRQPTPLDDEEVEWQLNLGEEPTGQRKKMKIHQDTSPILVTPGTTPSEVPDLFTSNEAYHLEESSSYTHSPFSAAAELPYLNSTYIPHSSYPGSANVGSFTLGFGTPNPLHPDNKENLEPMLNPLGRIDNPAAARLQAHNVQQYFVAQHTQPTHFFNSYPSNMPYASYYPRGFPTASYIPQVQYTPAVQYPYAPTMPMANPVRSTYTPVQPPVLPTQHTSPTPRRPQILRHLRTPSPQGTSIIDTSIELIRKKGGTTKAHRLMTRPGGPGSEDGDSGDDTVDEGSLTSE